MKKCPYCGAPVHTKNDAICAYCGGTLRDEKDIADGQYYDTSYSEQSYSQPTYPQQPTYSQQPYSDQLPPDYSERLRQAVQRGTLTPQSEATGKAQIAKILSILSIPFCTMLVLPIVSLVIACSVIKDPNANEAAIKTAKNAKTIAIVAICLGVLFYIVQVPLLNLAFS